MKSLDQFKNIPCSECGSTDLVWHCSQKNMGSAVDGKLQLNDIATEFVLGCNDCSETLKVISGDEMASLINASLSTAAQETTNELSEKLATLLRMAVQNSGSFNPDECLFVIEEQLTFSEYEMAEAFLSWVHSSNRTFGHNVKEVFLQYSQSKA